MARTLASLLQRVLGRPVSGRQASVTDERYTASNFNWQLEQQMLTALLSRR